MDDSDDEGFHEPPLQFMYIKAKKKYENHHLLTLNGPLGITPICLHYQLLLQTYPVQLDHYSGVKTVKKKAPSDRSPLDLVVQGVNESLLLSQFFPRKLSCVYNKFQQNLLLKRDMTIIIRNTSRRVCTEQLASFKERSRPTPSAGLSFSSEFQGGNLHCVFKSKKTGFYYLFIQNDTNTHGYNIWFHFNVKAAHEGKYQFVIVNMSRSVSFWDSICLPTFSCFTQEYDRSLKVNCIESCFKSCETQKNYHSMHFEYDFKEGESVYFSLVPPYSYSKLITFLTGTTETKSTYVNIQLQTAGISELGNTIPALVLSHPEKITNKVIVVTARQHPCEIVSSFVCQHIIKELLSDNQYEVLFENYSIFILPMLNPDGVIHGHSRTNILGFDINRTWGPQGQVNSIECKTISNYLESIQGRGLIIDWAIDLHGHSKSLGFFSYFSEETEETLIFQHQLKTKSSLFIPSNCTFGVGNSKRNSLRGVLYNRMGVVKSMTIQSSYYGCLNQDQQFEHWSTEHFTQIASSILSSIVETSKILKNRELKKTILDQISKKEQYCLPTLPKRNKDLSSDSDPEDGYLREQEREEDNLELARKTLEKISAVNKTKTETEGNFISSNFKIKQSESKQIRVDQQVKEVKSRKQQKKGLIRSQPKRRPSISMNKSTNERSYLSFSSLSILEERKKGRVLLTRDNKQCKLRRKVYSEHRYLINNHTHKEDSLEDRQPLKQSISFKNIRNSQNYSNLLQRRTEWERSKDVSSHCYNSIRLQTILYPTSHNASFAVNVHIKNLKNRVKTLREADNNQMMNTYSEAFQLRRSRKK